MSIELEKCVLELQKEVSVLVHMVQQFKDENTSLYFALQAERNKANLYVREVAQWIGKYDALLEQQSEVK